MSKIMTKTTVSTFLFCLALASILAVAMLNSTQAAQAAPDKVVMCHKPGTEDQATINVSQNAVHAHESHGDIIGTACEDISESSQLCSTLDGYVTSPTNLASSGFYELFTDTDLFAGETIEVTVTNTASTAHSYYLTLSDTFYASPITIFYVGETGTIAGGGSETITLNNLADPAGQTNFSLHMRINHYETPQGDTIFPDLQDVTFSFSCN